MDRSTSDAIWTAVVYGLHTVGGLYLTGAIRDLIRARSIAQAPDCHDISQLDLSKPTGLVKIHGWIRSQDPIRVELTQKPVVILSHVHSGKYVSYYGALREMFLSQDVRVAPFYLSTSDKGDTAEPLWISRQFSVTLPRVFCPDLLNTISEKTEQVRPFWSSFVASLLGVRLPFEHIERVAVLPDNCEAVVVSKVERDSSNRVRIRRTPWWSLFPPDVAVVTTSSIEDIIEEYETRAVDRTLAATGMFAFGFLAQYLRRNQ